MNEIHDFSVMKDGLNYKYFVNGKWKVSDSGEITAIHNPYNSDLIGYVQACNEKDVDEVVNSAKENVDCWENAPLKDRVDVLRKTADLMMKWAEPIGRILMQEIGKPLKSAISEIRRTADIFNATADAGSQIVGETIMGDSFKGFTKDKISMTYRVPLGVILCIGPFNYPFNLTGSKIAPALVAGNSVVMKPPSEGAITPLYLGVILSRRHRVAVRLSPTPQ